MSPTTCLDLLVAIVIIDEQQRIGDFLPPLDEIIGEGPATLDEVEVIPYGGRSRETDR